MSKRGWKCCGVFSWSGLWIHSLPKEKNGKGFRKNGNLPDLITAEFAERVQQFFQLKALGVSTELKHHRGGTYPCGEDNESFQVASIYKNLAENYKLFHE